MVRDDVRYLLTRHRIAPRKEAGQYFLIDDGVFDAIISAARLTARDGVLEIGAGIGTLTTRLAAQAGRVLAVEMDERFKPLLDALVRMHPSLSVHIGDFLKMPFDVIAQALQPNKKNSYAVVANIPYYITARIIRRLMTFELPPRRMVLLMQREVAERIVAAHGHHSKLSLAVHLYGTPAIVCNVPPSSFYPEPAVASAVMAISSIAAWRHKAEERFVWQLITFGFAAKRKKLASNIAGGLRAKKNAIEDALVAIGVPPEARAEHLKPEEWIALAEHLSQE